jgi:hypothetical protein
VRERGRSRRGGCNAFEGDYPCEGEHRRAWRVYQGGGANTSHNNHCFGLSGKHTCTHARTRARTHARTQDAHPPHPTAPHSRPPRRHAFGRPARATDTLGSEPDKSVCTEHPLKPPPDPPSPPPLPHTHIPHATQTHKDTQRHGHKTQDPRVLAIIPPPHTASPLPPPPHLSRDMSKVGPAFQMELKSKTEERRPESTPVTLQEPAPSTAQKRGAENQ